MRVCLLSLQIANCHYITVINTEIRSMQRKIIIKSLKYLYIHIFKKKLICDVHGVKPIYTLE